MDSFGAMLLWQAWGGRWPVALDADEVARRFPQMRLEGDEILVDDPKDLRPVCKRGPFFGYWQTRAWVALVYSPARTPASA